MKRAWILGAVWGALVLLLIPACYGRNCEGGITLFGEDAGQGRMVTPDKWESNPIDGRWLWFPRQAVYIFELHTMGDRRVIDVNASLSAVAEPTKGGGFAQAGGNLALISYAPPNRVDVRNDSCSDYYLRLTVEAEPFPPQSGSDAQPAIVGAGDASPPADAGDAGAPLE